MPSIQILIAEDEALVRNLLAHRLSMERDFKVIGEAANGRQAVELALRLRPDVILMDLSMPLLNGAQAAERIVSQFPHTKVIILTSLEEAVSIGKPWGVSECLGKGTPFQELAAAIRQAHSSRATSGSAEVDHSDQRAMVDRLALRTGLTDREKAVVEKVVTAELTIQEIAASLSAEWGIRVTPSAVRHALDRAMTKLRIEPRTRAALVKYVLRPEQSN